MRVGRVGQRELLVLLLVLAAVVEGEVVAEEERLLPQLEREQEQPQAPVVVVAVGEEEESLPLALAQAQPEVLQAQEAAVVEQAGRSPLRLPQGPLQAIARRTEQGRGPPVHVHRFLTTSLRRAAGCQRRSPPRRG